MKATESKFVRIAYTAPESKLNAREKGAREHLETAIHQAIEQFYDEATGQDMLLEIELYPCDENCKECREAAA